MDNFTFVPNLIYSYTAVVFNVTTLKQVLQGYKQHKMLSTVHKNRLK